MRRVVLVLLLVGFAVVVFAQNPNPAPQFAPGDDEGLVVSPNPRVRYAWKRKVFWRISSPEPSRPSRLIPAQTAAERVQITAALDALTAVLKATPTGSAGEGFWVQDSRTIDYADPFDVPATTPLAKFPLAFSTGLFPFYHSDLESSGTWRLSVAGETESVYFHFNRLPLSLDATPILTEAPVATTRRNRSTCARASPPPGAGCRSTRASFSWPPARDETPGWPCRWAAHSRRRWAPSRRIARPRRAVLPATRRRSRP